MQQRLAILPFMLLCSIAACGGGGSNVCEVNEDCDSHFCKADGTCGPASGDDAGGDDDTLPDGSSDLCSPNADGMITQAELPLRAGKMARFRVALDTTFDTAGTAASGGMRAWDLSGALSDDTDKPISLDAPGTAYWATDFPTASYATPLSQDPDNDLLGIFHVDDDAVTLLGIVSPAAGQFSTNVSYDPPATILKLPVTSGAHWTSTSNVTGMINGGFVNYDEKYDANVDQLGTMKTPYGTFPVMRVATDLTQLQLGTPYNSNRSFAWIAECFGSVANVTSKANETSAEFTDPAEVKRLIP